MAAPPPPSMTDSLQPKDGSMPTSTPPRTSNGSPQIAGDAASAAPYDRLDAIEQAVREQGASVRKTQQGFAIFAFFALIIAMITLLTVALKLDAKTTTSKAAAPAIAAPVAKTPA